MITNNHKTTNMNNYGLTEEELQQAQAYLELNGYMDETEDIINYTRSMVEGIPFMVTRKIQQWSQLYEKYHNG